MDTTDVVILILTGFIGGFGFQCILDFFAELSLFFRRKNNDYKKDKKD